MGRTRHGWSTIHELHLLVGAGLTPLQAITAATGHSARALGVDHERGVIAPGRLADLVLVAGAPLDDIRDLRRIRRVFLGGREIDRPRLGRALDTPRPTRLPSRRVGPLLSETVRPGARSPLGTFWSLGEERPPFGGAPIRRLHLPLTPGELLPADVSRYRGLEFRARGAGRHRLVVPTRRARDRVWFSSGFETHEAWVTHRVPFASLHRDDPVLPVRWTGRDVMSVVFETEDRDASGAWAEIADLRLY